MCTNFKVLQKILKFKILLFMFILFIFMLQKSKHISFYRLTILHYGKLRRDSHLGRRKTLMSTPNWNKKYLYKNK